MTNEPISPDDQDILIVSHPSTTKLDQVTAGRHPEDAQDLIIAGPDGIVYHVKKEDWKSSATKLGPDQVPPSVNTLIDLSSVVAYVSSPVQPAPPVTTSAGDKPIRLAPSKSGYYLANFALLNPTDGSSTPDKTAAPEVLDVYRIPKKGWIQHRLCPGDSVFVLEMLQRGTIISYIPMASRVSNCVCYLMNLASLNGVTVFEPSPMGQACYTSSPDGPGGVPVVLLETKSKM